MDDSLMRRFLSASGEAEEGEVISRNPKGSLKEYEMQTNNNDRIQDLQRKLKEMQIKHSHEKTLIIDSVKGKLVENSERPGIVQGKMLSQTVEQKKEEIARLAEEFEVARIQLLRKLSKYLTRSAATCRTAHSGQRHFAGIGRGHVWQA